MCQISWKGREGGREREREKEREREREKERGNERERERGERERKRKEKRDREREREGERKRENERESDKVAGTDHFLPKPAFAYIIPNAEYRVAYQCCMTIVCCAACEYWYV